MRTKKNVSAQRAEGARWKWGNNDLGCSRFFFFFFCADVLIGHRDVHLNLTEFPARRISAPEITGLNNDNNGDLHLSHRGL